MRDESSRPRRGPPIWIVIGFLLAFAATVVTVVLTGLYVRAPGAGRQDERAPAVRTEREPASSPVTREPASVRNEREPASSPGTQESASVRNERSAPQ